MHEGAVHAAAAGGRECGSPQAAAPHPCVCSGRAGGDSPRAAPLLRTLPALRQRAEPALSGVFQGFAGGLGDVTELLRAPAVRGSGAAVRGSGCRAEARRGLKPKRCCQAQIRREAKGEKTVADFSPSPRVTGSSCDRAGEWVSLSSGPFRLRPPSPPGVPLHAVAQPYTHPPRYAVRALRLQSLEHSPWCFTPPLAGDTLQLPVITSLWETFLFSLVLGIPDTRQAATAHTAKENFCR